MSNMAFSSSDELITKYTILTNLNHSADSITHPSLGVVSGKCVEFRVCPALAELVMGFLPRLPCVAHSLSQSRIVHHPRTLQKCSSQGSMEKDRAPRACAACQRAKRRCDKALPHCSLCVRYLNPRPLRGPRCASILRSVSGLAD